MVKYSIIIFSTLALTATSFAHHKLIKKGGPDPEHGGNDTHQVCIGTIPSNFNAQGVPMATAQKLALLVDNQPSGEDNGTKWVNIVRGVFGLEDYFGVADDAPTAHLRIANTLPKSMPNDFLFDGEISNLADGLHLSGTVKIAASSLPNNTAILNDVVFSCTDVTPFSIQDAVQQAKADTGDQGPQQ